MNDLLESPEGFYDHVRRYTASVASSLTYGYRAATFGSFWAYGVYDVMGKVNRLAVISGQFSQFTVDGGHGTWGKSPRG